MNEFIKFLKDSGPDSTYRLKTIVNTINDTGEFIAKERGYSGGSINLNYINIVRKSEPHFSYALLYFKFVEYNVDSGGGKSIIRPIYMKIIKRDDQKAERIEFT